MAFLTPRYYVRRSAISRQSLSSPDNISLDVARARALLEKSKAKLLEREQGTTAVLESPKIPFFATRLNGSKKRRKDVIADVNEAGLVRVNGAALAAWSEQEEWQSRSILEVFNVTEQQEEVSDPFENVETDSPRRLAASRTGSRRRDAPDRDVVAAIWNLRQSMRNEDFERIFDEKNRFIGEQ
jgi:hypothetical protein